MSVVLNAVSFATFVYAVESVGELPLPRVTAKFVPVFDPNSCTDAMIKYFAVLDGEVTVNLSESIK